MKKSVSVIIPCRNEESHIGNCLDTIISQEYPKELLEVIVVDGMSDDRTREIIQEYSDSYPFIKLKLNKHKFTPYAMNIGITNSTGDLLVMINSHAVINKFFLMNSVRSIESTKADAVGGMLNTINIGDDLISKTIPLAADSLFGTGGNRYRTRTKEGYVTDTLPYCLYQKDVFNKIGMIDEDLIRDQDEEFNYRLLKYGGKIYYSPTIKSHLYIRASFKKLWMQHYQYGYFKPLVALKVGTFFTWRQTIPALFVGSLLITSLLSLVFWQSIYLFAAIGLLYFCVNLIFSLVIAVTKGIKHLFILPIAFSILHTSYGLGYLKGIWDFIILKKHVKKKIKDIPLTR
ncbi:MAG: glycosyltransferase family 2 protein [Chloroflexi bacterium]|nr:glycosyltransferase family 2 protein [Chloroflexota bacterium]